jgi:hypothetical protein
MVGAGDESSLQAAAVKMASGELTPHAFPEVFLSADPGQEAMAGGGEGIRRPLMAEIASVWSEARPWLHVVSSGTAWAVEEALPPGGSCFVVHLDGGDMVDAQGVFEVFSRLFRFPVYFGWNWPALSDCLQDLSWVPSRRCLVVVERPGKMLSEEEEDLPVLLRILNRTGEYWARSIGRGEEWEGQEVAFNVLFLCAEEEIAAVRDAIREA